MRLRTYRWLLVFGTLLAGPVAGVGQNKWEAAIQAFEKSDRETPPPASPIVFTGSSSFTLWTDLPAQFPDKPILNRGFGGCQLSDVLHFADRVILAYRPRQVVVYAGDNDLAVGKSPQEVYRLFRVLFRRLRQAQPGLPVVFVAIKPSPVRWKFRVEAAEANRLVRRFLRRQRNADFVDVVPTLLDPLTQRPLPELFKPDSLHLNAAGYQRWAVLLKPVLR